MTKPKEAEDSPELKQATTKSRSTPGFHNKFVRIKAEHWDKITKYADANCLDIDKWLTSRIAEIADLLNVE